MLLWEKFSDQSKNFLKSSKNEEIYCGKNFKHINDFSSFNISFCNMTEIAVIFLNFFPYFISSLFGLFRKYFDWSKNSFLNKVIIKESWTSERFFKIAFLKAYFKNSISYFSVKNKVFLKEIYGIVIILWNKYPKNHAIGK